MICLYYDNLDPYLNLAFEEYVLRNLTDGDYLLLWRSEASVILGRNQNLYEEVHVRLAEQLGIPVLRRESGGGAVFHDPGNLNFSFITDAGSPDDRRMECFTEPVARALRAWGIPAECSGRNDIEVRGRKVSGSAQTIWKDRLLHHGTLLFNSDLELAGRLLKPDSRKYISHGVASVRSRIANLQDTLPPSRRGADITDLRAHLIEFFHCNEIAPGEHELAAVRELADRKYRDPAWLLEDSMDFDVHNNRQLSGGILDAQLQIRNHCIRALRLRGDFLSSRPVEELESLLTGTAYTEMAVRKQLQFVDLQPYLGDISPEELFSVLFD